MNHAAAALETQHHFVLVSRQCQQRSDLMAHAFGRRRLDVTVKVQHVNASLGLGLLFLFLQGLALLLAQRLETVLVQQRLLKPLAQAFVKVIQASDLQLSCRLASALATHGRNGDQHDHDGNHQRYGFSQKTCVIDNEIHEYPSLALDPLCGRGCDDCSIPTPCSTHQQPSRYKPLKQ
ncbi:hypothetical protein ALP71_02712 [Pseudomonas coronafaciens pv. garcae]|nr:hypothetical protein ALP71_02712 [Pseudomonas coronafaciens pv. garcae]